MRRLLCGLTLVLALATRVPAQEPGRAPLTTGAVTVISGDRLRETPAASVLEALRDLVPGMDILPSGNFPGEGLMVTIRGPRDLSSGMMEPLYVIDGVTVSNGIDYVPLDAVGSVRILRDAAATARYGNLGVNGVVELTTRTGVGAPVRFRVNGYVGTQQIRSMAQLMTGAQFAEFRREGNRALGQTLSDASMFTANELEGIQQNRTTDWQGLISRTGQVRNLSLSAGGKPGQTAFQVTGDAFGQTGVTQGQQYRQYRGAASVARDLGPVRLGATVLGSASRQDLGAGDTAWTMALTADPLVLARDASGAPIPDPVRRPNAVSWNPLIAIDGISHPVRKSRVFGALSADAAIIPGLHWRGTAAADVSSTRDRYAEDGRVFMVVDHLVNVDEIGRKYSFETELNFTRMLGTGHHVDAAIGVGLQQPRDSLMLFGSAGGGSPTFRPMTPVSWRQSWYLGRIEYARGSRYLVSVSTRSDGDSRLAGLGRQTTTAVGATWRISDEAWFRSLGTFSNLELRASLGRIEPTPTAMLCSGCYDTATLPGRTAEVLRQADVGVDARLLNGRVHASLDLYRRDDDNQYVAVLLPSGGGYAVQLRDILSVRNSGLELGVSAEPIRHWRGLSWSAGLRLTNNGNQVTGIPADDITNRLLRGQPLTIGDDWRYQVFYDYRADGIWQTGQAAEAQRYGARPGSIRVSDLNGDGSITAPGDRMILGSTYPRWVAGLSNELRYRGLDLSVLAAARTGYMIQDQSIRSYRSLALDYWTPANPSNAFPRPPWNSGTAFWQSLSYRSGSHWRIRQAVLGYTLAPRRVGGRSIRVYAATREPWVSGQFNGFDPESEANLATPPFRTLTMGASATF